MTVTKRLKLKLILLMLSSCSFSQHIPLTAMSEEIGVIAEEKKKDEIGECTPVTGHTPGMIKPIGRSTAKANNQSSVVEKAAYVSLMTPQAASLQHYQPEATRYWESEQRSAVM